MIASRAAVLALSCLVLGAVSPDARPQSGVARTRHNLTATGPGEKRSAEASGVCVFCHAPHNAAPSSGLWNRALSGVTYQLYSSSTMKAQLDQPTGASRLCLSCHDGLLALGNVRRPDKEHRFGLGPLTGATVLGTDLSDDHPVSFTYDSALALRRGGLADPSALAAAVRLDEKRQLQCTSCHDAHEDRRAHFLRLDDRYSTLCITCHRLPAWSGSAHATSRATWTGVGASPWSEGAYPTVAENGCASCHRPHAAPRPQWLLAQASEPANCTVCHRGNVAAKNVEAEFLKPFRHPVESNQWTHEPGENALLAPRHVACSDCHNPHAASSIPGAAPGVSGKLRGVEGVTLSGSPIREAGFEHEVCSKCHGMKEPVTPGILRQSGTRNIRSKIDSSNRSYHPIASIGANPSIRGLMADYSASSLITCTSCHNNDDWVLPGTNPRGPHGSRYEAILERQYLTNDPMPESPQSYDLCYKCHNRSFLVNDQAGTFPHRKHVVDAAAACAACHDAHGSKQNAHLVDFMLRDRTGKVVVSRSAVQNRMEFISLGPGRGQCYLQCHGVNHEPRSY